MVTLRRTWHVHFDTDAEELLAGVQAGMVAGPRCRTHSHAAERARTPALDPWRDSGCQGSGGTHPSTVTWHIHAVEELLGDFSLHPQGRQRPDSRQEPV
jgi:hypothetical protein